MNRHPGLLVAALLLFNTLIPARVAAQTEERLYARIAVLRPHDGKTVDFEAGYIRHLEFHAQMKDPWTWFGWTVWAGDRQRWFVYATFGHSAAALDGPVAPAEDERDNILNVTPHAQFVGNALYEYLPAMSRGSGQPQAAARLEFTTVELSPEAAGEFEAALRAAQPQLAGETLWFRMVAGGTSRRYVRLRPFVSLSSLLADRTAGSVPAGAAGLPAKTTIEILNLRPTLSYRLPADRR